jgi:hypothetical protein
MLSNFTNVAVQELLEIVTNKLQEDDTLAESSVLQVEVIMGLMEVCLNTACIQGHTGFCNKRRIWLWEAPLPSG